jgi:hypothetical protein
VSGVISVFSLNACVVTWPAMTMSLKRRAVDIIILLASFLAAVPGNQLDLTFGQATRARQSEHLMPKEGWGN